MLNNNKDVNMEEYLIANGIKMKAQDKEPTKVTGDYVDPDIEAWYKANKIDGPIKTLKDVKMKEQIKKLKAELSSKGNKALKLDSEKDKDNAKKDIDEATSGGDKKEKNIDKKQDENKKEEKPKTAVEKQKEEQEYLDKLIKLHEEKMKIYKEQRKKDSLVPTNRELILMIRLQQEINKGKSEYEEKYGKEELNKLINKNFKEEKKLEKQILTDHQNKIDELERLNKELDEVLGKIEALEYQMTKGQISIEDYEKEKDFMQDKKLKVLWDINEMDPAILADEEKQYEENEKFKDKNLGQNYIKEERKDLNISNEEMSKKIEGIKRDQKGEVEKTNEELEETHRESILNKEIAIDDLQTKIAKTTDEDKKIEMTEQVAELKLDKAISNEQKEVTMDAEKASYSEIENPTKIENNLGEELEVAIKEFKDVIEEQEEIEKKIPSDEEQNVILRVPEKSDNSFIADIQDCVEEDPEKYLNSIKEITGKARDYNKELEENLEIK